MNGWLHVHPSPSYGWQVCAERANDDCSFLAVCNGEVRKYTWLRDGRDREDGCIVNALSNGTYGLYVPDTGKQWAVQTVTRLSPSKVEYGPVWHTRQPMSIAYPLTGDFAAGQHDAIIERMEVGDVRTFGPRVDLRDKIPFDSQRVSLRVRRVK